MTEEVPSSSFPIGSRVTFPYGGSRRTGVVTDVSMMPDGRGGSSVAYLVEVGQRKVFVQGDGVSAAGEGTPAQEGEIPTYGRRRPRSGGGRRR